MVYCIVEVATNVCRAFRRIVVLQHALAMLSASFYSIAIYCVFCEASSEKLVYGLATCQCNRTFQGLQFSGGQEVQLCPFYKLKITILS